MNRYQAHRYDKNILIEGTRGTKGGALGDKGDKGSGSYSGSEKRLQHKERCAWRILTLSEGNVPSK